MSSIVEYYAENSGRCGYCGSPNTNFSHGMWAHTLKVSDYQDLIDRGWRRSGKYCYKPTMDVTCCPMYTIRCKALEFKATKSQKKILKYFNKHIIGADGNSLINSGRKMSTSSSGHDEQHLEEGREEFVESSREHQTINFTSVMNTKIQDGIETIDESKSSPLGSVEVPHPSFIIEKESPKTKNIQKVVGPDPSRPICKKAKQLRRERKLEKLKEKGIDITNLTNTCKNKEKQLEDFINEISEDFKDKLKIRLVRTNPPSPRWLATSTETHEVYVKYQTVIHNDRPAKCTKQKFLDFLVHSPLIEEYSATGPACGYGSFHQQYWFNGKIIAVGVIDILPKCVSSVYFFYDPDYMQLSLGTYGALREIEFTRALNKTSPDLLYYYMGFYIHTCRKMRYKGNFHPSDLLCPETYKWFPIKDCISKLEVSPYTRLDPDLDSIDENFPNEDDLDYMPIWFKGTIMLNKVYRRKCNKRTNDTQLMEYARLVGKKTLKKLVLFRD